MINPISSAASSLLQDIQAVKPQTAAAPPAQSSKSSTVQDTVELSAEAKAALSGDGSKTGQSKSPYAPPSTTSAYSNRAAAATK